MRGGGSSQRERREPCLLACFTSEFFFFLLLLSLSFFLAIRHPTVVDSQPRRRRSIFPPPPPLSFPPPPSDEAADFSFAACVAYQSSSPTGWREGRRGEPATRFLTPGDQQTPVPFSLCIFLSFCSKQLWIASIEGEGRKKHREKRGKE